MASANITKLAKMLIAASKGLSTTTRAPQLPSSSITTPSGESIELGVAVEAAVDANAGVEFLDDTVSDISDYAGISADDISYIPERVQENRNAFDVGVAAAQRADEAQAAAEQAAVDAAASLVGMNGKNARRAGRTEADLVPPETGWVDGDEWIVLNDDGTPVELRLRAGDAWVPYNLIASSVLVLGEDGTVQIRNGLITAPKLAVDALDFKTAKGMEVVGGTMIGGTMIGGTITLADPGAGNRTWYHDGSTLDGWSSPADLSIVTSPARDGKAVRVSDGSLGATVTISGGGVYGTMVSFWVHPEREALIYLRVEMVNNKGEAFFMESASQAVAGGAWTRITEQINIATVTSVRVVSSLTSGWLVIDDVEIRRYNNGDAESGISIYRTGDATAVFESSQGAKRMRVIGGDIYSDYTDGRTSRAVISHGRLYAGGEQTHDAREVYLSANRTGGVNPGLMIKSKFGTFAIEDDAEGTSISVHKTDNPNLKLRMVAPEIEHYGKTTLREPVTTPKGFISTEVTDWNDAMTAGFYFATNGANGPFTGWFSGVVTTNETNGRVLQEVREARATTHATVHRRYWHGSGWTPWSTDDDRDLWIKRTVTGLTWPGSGNGWAWTAAVRITFPSGKFNKKPFMGGVHTTAEGFMIFAMLMNVQQTYFEVRFLKYSAVALTSAALEYSAHER